MKYNNPITIFLFLSLSFLPSMQNKLTPDYYKKTCPTFLDTVRRIVNEKQHNTPSTAAATLRLLFHDCMVGGCDASILVTSNAYNKAERDHTVNLPLSGDGFDAVLRVKNVLELECPNVVSCADILAAAAGELVANSGGPTLTVQFGRKDSLESKISSSENQFPLPNMTMSQVITLFTKKGFSVQEMVALIGAHTIGMSHCDQFAHRLFGFSKTSETDPAYSPEYAAGLRKLCENYTKDSTMAAYNDVITPVKFDNMYFKNLRRGLGLLATDSALFTDPRTKPFVETYADDEGKFFQDFSRAIEKLSALDIKTGKEGEVRSRCDSFNSLN
ncbi:hypothetical protein LR48_Vigan511s006700 [Vigna angularis]|uniref:Peroxidase n=2 Tax=Phaseolus angularis TaxID=3914 RepID=A0A0L9TDJ9_PHAAN|nr:peroxidase 31 [Vigna angularis]KAG2409427.1 Peroxidase 65 [Vigna angularis]KOM28244.1 hypothetical protein LR48_Vigan511s006700 [Vigna angularis]BAT74629.1 hypothetical protein VIGAN_01233600 [Vigna angularis var. angularis]